MKWKRSWVRRAEVLPIALAVALALWASGASAYTVDQRNDSAATGGYHSIPNYTPIGQEFRPDLDHVDVAELYVKAMGFVSDPTEFLVEVYALDASGELLSTSGVVPAAAGYIGPLLFTFPESVPLVPGDLYVLVIRELNGVNWGVRATEDLYPSGQFIQSGVPIWHTDAWFREGVLPSAVSARTWAAIKSLYHNEQ